MSSVECRHGVWGPTLDIVVSPPGALCPGPVESKAHLWLTWVLKGSPAFLPAASTLSQASHKPLPIFPPILLPMKYLRGGRLYWDSKVLRRGYLVHEPATDIWKITYLTFLLLQSPWTPQYSGSSCLRGDPVFQSALGPHGQDPEGNPADWPMAPHNTPRWGPTATWTAQRRACVGVDGGASENHARTSHTAVLQTHVELLLKYSHPEPPWGISLPNAHPRWFWYTLCFENHGPPPVTERVLTSYNLVCLEQGCPLESPGQMKNRQTDRPISHCQKFWFN